jgi:hypothetical protein
MFVFIAGARTTVPVKARYMVERKSSASPLANFAMRSAVAGATIRSSFSVATLICSIADSRAQRLVIASFPVSAAKVSG